jgi:hypothetical protein
MPSPQGVALPLIGGFGLKGFKTLGTNAILRTIPCAASAGATRRASQSRGRRWFKVSGMQWLGHMLIGGEWEASGAGETFEDVNPATGQMLAELLAATATNVDSALAAA